MTRDLTILGATGSVGRASVDVALQANAGAAARGEAPAFRFDTLSAHRDWQGLVELARLCAPAQLVLSGADSDPASLESLRQAMSGTGTAVAGGPEALEAAAGRHGEMVMAAIVGAAGLRPALAAAARGATIALANKECLVSAGPVFLDAVAHGGATLLPVDSEHNAMFQVLDHREQVEKLILTASGGPFRTWSAEAIAAATPEQALAHPNWSMGRKITIDSANLMNKGLELIEAAYLFDMPEASIDVLVHPQSVVHSLVAYRDGSVLAQLGAADMRIPIAHVLGWPKRLAVSTPRLDLAALGRLDFEPPDLDRFPALGLARAALRDGAALANVLNAANEIAVQAFLDRNVTFPEIAAIVAESLERASRQGLCGRLSTVEDVMEADAAGRAYAGEAVSTRRGLAA